MTENSSLAGEHHAVRHNGLASEPLPDWLSYLDYMGPGRKSQGVWCYISVHRGDALPARLAHPLLVCYYMGVRQQRRSHCNTTMSPGAGRLRQGVEVEKLGNRH